MMHLTSFNQEYILENFFEIDINKRIKVFECFKGDNERMLISFPEDLINNNNNLHLPMSQISNKKLFKMYDSININEKIYRPELSCFWYNPINAEELRDIVFLLGTDLDIIVLKENDNISSIKYLIKQREDIESYKLIITEQNKGDFIKNVIYKIESITGKIDIMD